MKLRDKLSGSVMDVSDEFGKTLLESDHRYEKVTAKEAAAAAKEDTKEADSK